MHHFKGNHTNTADLSSLMEWHQEGYYYLQLTPDNCLIEVVLIAFPAKSGTRSHCHRDSFSFNFVLPIGKTKELKSQLYHVMGGQIIPLGLPKLNKELEIDLLPPYLIHSLGNVGSDIVFSLHCYLPSRKLNLIK